MEPVSLTAVADEQLAAARQASSGRAARTLHGGQGARLRQAVLALLAGQELAEHENPGEATLHVLRGRIRLRTATETCDAAAGDHVVIPPARHAVEALDDAAVLLTALVR
ncbi:cupin domain-containing protein [Saccharopolyspora rhizosphaerae]|uniref:Cupin domain-containing protein n=1 Tax=Saccharopolyspora rhizosphaerae TaxID=2492662 RepID=A0A3R8Q2U4_9PSEU|nr:cupin domain-containing protein [Saccharopolyspora rhizosphaerae]RRO15744.1 cupin domain-containing protein [Saccharopolyspora rhizosphaerae]